MLAITVDDSEGLQRALQQGAQWTASPGESELAHQACQHQSLECLDVLWKAFPDRSAWQTTTNWAAGQGFDTAVMHLWEKGAQLPGGWAPVEITMEMIDQALASIEERRQQLGIAENEALLPLLPYLGQVKVVAAAEQATGRHQALTLDQMAWETGAMLVFERVDQAPTLWLAQPLAERLAPAMAIHETPVRKGPRLN